MQDFGLNFSIVDCVFLGGRGAPNGGGGIVREQVDCIENQVEKLYNAKEVKLSWINLS